jgi:hypothetical protein
MAGLEAQGMGDLSPALLDIINRGFDFGNTFLSAKYAKDAARFTGGGNFQLQTTGATNDAQALLVAEQYRRAQELASASITADGLLIGGTRITWPTIAIVGVGVYLLQSQGFSRRGR